MSAKDVREAWIELYLVLVQVLVELFCAKHLHLIIAMIHILVSFFSAPPPRDGVKPIRRKTYAFDLCNPDKLVIVVMAMEERLLPKDHGSQHTTEAPHVQAGKNRIIKQEAIAISVFVFLIRYLKGRFKRHSLFRLLKSRGAEIVLGALYQTFCAWQNA